MSKPIVLITGISGFVGSHTALELVKQGYAVRGTARSAKAAILKSTINNPDIDIVVLDDVATGDITEALKGVHAVIHIAAPLAGKESTENSLKSAIEGSLNILRQAVAAGVNKVVLTSSWGATLHPSLKQAFAGLNFNADSWGNFTREETIASPNPMIVYLATKILSEQAVWEFAKEHPELDIATILPPFIYGPYAPGFPLPNASSLSSNKLLYSLIYGEPGRPLPMLVPPFFTDVRDVAKAHVLALKVPKESPILGTNKRYLISGGHYTWKEATEHIAEVLPELKPRLPSTANDIGIPGKLSTIDIEPAKRDLGLTEYIPWQTTVTDSIKSLLEVEKSWKKQ